MREEEGQGERKREESYRVQEKWERRGKKEGIEGVEGGE